MDELSQIFNINIEKNTQSHKKGQILQEQGKVATKAYFVKKGLLKSYTIDAKGREHIFMFAPENWMISDIESQQFDQPAELTIECIEDSEVVVINRSDLKDDDENVEYFNKMQVMLFRRIAVLQRRIIMMMRATAQERYEKFLEDYPELPNRVPQWMIASYLGITPEALSKIRGQMAKYKKD